MSLSKVVVLSVSKYLHQTWTILYFKIYIPICCYYNGKVKVVITVNFTCVYALKSFNGGVHLGIVLTHKHRKTTIFVIIMYETYYKLFVSRIFFNI